MKIAIGLAGLILSIGSVHAGEIVPIEDFARSEQFSEAELSPDGKHFAFMAVCNGLDTLYFAETAAPKKAMGLDLGKANFVPAQREVIWYRWLGDKRVLIDIGAWTYGDQGVGACDYNGRNWTGLTGTIPYTTAIRIYSDRLMAFKCIYSFDDDVHVLMLDQKYADGSEQTLYPHVVRLNTRSGFYERVVTNPGDVVDWTADQNGIVRIGTKKQAADKSELIYRENDKSPWVPLKDLIPDMKPNPSALGFDATGQAFYFFAKNDSGFSVLYRCDLLARKIGAPILELPGNDVFFDHGPKDSGPIWSRDKHAIVGFRYETEGPQVVWFDPQYTAVMAKIDRSLPGLLNLPVSTADQGRLWLIHSYSDTEPGVYYLFDVEKSSLHLLLNSRPWIRRDLMAEMHPVHFQARDGLDLHGYLTVPTGAKRQNLPLVVLPHGGPWFRDTWGFNPMVQMLANRGYAVLQVNYRGSAGYGSAFSEKGTKEVGGAIQNDIEDATRWAIAQGIADPKRIAILGGSYGGYSVLFALGKTPELYRCGVAIAAVSDWVKIYGNLNEPAEKYSKEYWVEQIGDPKVDRERLAEISPVNFANSIVAPLLILHGKEDLIVPIKQARQMVAALEKLGREPETLFLPGESHSFKKDESRLAEYKAIEAFLAKYLGPGIGVRSVDHGKATSGKN